MDAQSVSGRVRRMLLGWAAPAGTSAPCNATQHRTVVLQGGKHGNALVHSRGQMCASASPCICTQGTGLTAAAMLAVPEAHAASITSNSFMKQGTAGATLQA